MARFRAAAVVPSTICLIILLVSGSFSLADDEIRTWTDSTGKHKIKAKFVALDGENVTLEKDDGSEVELPLKKLSKNDQQLAKELASKSDNPFESKSDDPFQSKEKKATKNTKSGPEVELLDAPASNASVIALASANDKWDVSVPDVSEDLSLSKKPKIATLPPKASFFEKINQVIVNPKAKKAVVGYSTDFPQDKMMSRIVLVDLTTGSASKVEHLTALCRPLDLNDDGNQILIAEMVDRSKGDAKFEIWTMNGSKVVHRKCWTPFEGENHNNKEITWARFLENQQIAIACRSGKVCIWQLPDLEPLYSIQLSDGAIPALSPDRKRLAFCDGDEFGLFDLAEREVIAQAATPQKLPWPVMAFSPSGKQFACLSHMRLLAWDTASGNLICDMEPLNIPAQGVIDFPADDHVLLGKEYLFQLAEKLQLWRYSGQDEVRTAGGWTFFAVSDGDKKPGALAGAQLPHSGIHELQQQALKDPTLFALKENTEVKLDLSGISDNSMRAKVTENLTKQLAVNQCTVGSNGKVILAATVTGPKQSKLSFRHAGDYPFQEWTSTVKILFEGKTLWEARSTNAPGFLLRLKDGENIESALRKYEKPNYDWFGHIRLPKYLQKNSSAEPGVQSGFGLGQSRITVSGIR